MAFTSFSTLQNIQRYIKNDIIYSYTGSSTFTPNINGYDVLLLDTSGTLILNIPGTINYYIMGGGGAGGAWYIGGGNGGNGGVLSTGAFTNNISDTYIINIGSGGKSTTPGTQGTSGGITTLTRNTLSISVNGGYGGKSVNSGSGGGNTQGSQTNATSGGMGSNETNTSRYNDNNTIVQLTGPQFPDGNYYGSAGSGGLKNNATVTPPSGAGKGGNSTTAATSATSYGCGGGGGGNKTGGRDGGSGFRGVVLLYWNTI
jgi:hypothetical protein